MSMKLRHVEGYIFVSGSDIEAGAFANIEFNPFCSTEGCLYQITPSELELLDKFVGYPEVCTFLLICGESENKFFIYTFSWFKRQALDSNN